VHVFCGLFIHLDIFSIMSGWYTKYQSVASSSPVTSRQNSLPAMEARVVRRSFGANRAFDRAMYDNRHQLDRLRYFSDTP
jgi:hypothetical protein